METLEEAGVRGLEVVTSLSESELELVFLLREEEEEPPKRFRLRKKRERAEVADGAAAVVDSLEKREKSGEEIKYIRKMY